MDKSLYKPKARWPLFVGGSFAALVVLYLFVTSSVFLRWFVLPRVAAALGSRMHVTGISLSPFSSLRLSGLRLDPRGAETLVAVEDVLVRYDLGAILGGTLTIRELTVEGPSVTVVEKADGTSNLSAFLDALSGPPKASQPSGPSKPVQFDLSKIVLRNGTLRYTRQTAEGPSEAEVSGLQVSLDRWVSGQQGKVVVEMGLRNTAQGTNQITARLAGSVGLELDPSLSPRRVDADITVSGVQGAGLFRDTTGLGLRLEAVVNPEEVQRFRIAVSKQSLPAGELVLSGPFNLAQREARLEYALSGIDRVALGPVAVLLGMDPGQTRVSASGRLDVTRQGQLVASFGKLGVDTFSLKTVSGTTPVLDLGLDYRFRVDLAAKSALLEKVDLSVRQQSQTILRGGLDRPMNLSWAGSVAGFREATFSMEVTGFDLAPWKAVAGTNLPSGRVDMKAALTADRDGRRLRLQSQGGVEGVALGVGGIAIRDVGASWSLEGSLEDFQVLAVDRLAATLRHQGRSVATASGEVRGNQRSEEISVQSTVEAQIPELLRLVPVDGIRLDAGVLRWTGQAAVASGKTNLTASVALEGLTGLVKGVALDEYRVGLETMASLSGTQVAVRKGSLSLRSGSSPGGSLDVTGDYDLGLQRGALDIRSVNLNEKAIGPFVALALAPKRLESVSLDWNGKLGIDLAGQSSVKSSLRITRLLVTDPEGVLPRTPLALGIELDGLHRGQTVTVNKLVLDLGSTPRASNRIEATALVDLSPQKAEPSRVKITSDGIDLDPIYDLLMGGRTTAGKESPKTTPATLREPSSTLGKPIQLPIQRLGFESEIARVHFREIAVTNWVTKVSTEGSRIQVQPLSLTLNGAPVSAAAKVDLGVQGYQYETTGSLDRIPVAPAVHSFVDRSLMEAEGTMSAKWSITGSGVAVPELRKTLKGSGQFLGTNLNYRVTAAQNPLIETLVMALSGALRIPNLSRMPVDVVSASAEVDQGVVQIRSFEVGNATYLASGRGRIELQDVLDDSRYDIPISVSVPDELTKKREALPDFLTIRGTVGNPKADIDPAGVALALTRLPGPLGDLVNQGAGRVEKTVERVVGGAGAAVGNALKGLFGGEDASSSTNATRKATNAPVRPLNPLKLFK
jgi:AsmA family/AsmA-like C-terminal region